MTLNDSEGPVPSTEYRVPRTRVDDYFERGQPVEPTRAGAGVVTSVDGDTCSVLIGDEEVEGVIYTGDPPVVGDAYELEQRGNLLVALPDDYNYAGVIGGGPHIVDDDQPTAPPSQEIQIAGSMKSVDFWNILDPASGWHRAPVPTGIRAWQANGVLQARNLMPTPSYEAGLGLWYSTGAPVATLADDTARYLFGAHSMRVEWKSPTVAGTGAAAVHPKIALDPAKQYTLSMWVYVPEGSPDVRATAVTRAGGPWVTDREQWTYTEVTFSPTDAAGDLVGIEALAPVTGTQVWVDGVVLREAGTPMPPTQYFGGSMPPTPDASFGWDGAAEASTSFWRNGPAAGSGTGVLWSTEEFDVISGDTLDVAAVLTHQIGAYATAQLVVAYSPSSDRDPAPLTDPVVAYGTPVSVTGDAIALAAQAIVPATIGAGTDTPKSAVIGIRLVGPGTSDLVVVSATLTQTTTVFPTGSLWLNPVAGSALPTVGVTAATSVTGGGALASATAWTRIPTGKKAIVTAPPDSGGILLLFSSAGVVGVTTNVATLEFMHHVDGVACGQIQRCNSVGGASGVQLPVFVVGSATVAPGQTVECWLAYQYSTAPGATVQNLRGYTMTVVFIPTGVAAGDTAKPAPVSFWDGESWVQGMLDPALMDLTKDATVVEAAKTSTTTALTRSDADVHAGTDVTLTATVSPAASGSVTFHRGPSSSGPWTSLGTATVSSGKATKKTTQGSSDTFYYRATYGGSSTHAGSTSGTVSVKYRTQTVAIKTYNAQWVQAYAGDGSKVSSGTGFDNGVHQGVASSGSGNRKSLIRFNPPSFSGTEVNVTRVTLVCRKWQKWMAGDSKGTVVCGWHENKSGSEPGSYPSSQTHNDKSRHARDEGAWEINLTSWADAVVLRSDFGGITVGPGGSGAAEFYGWSDNGPGRWDLVVEASSWV